MPPRVRRILDTFFTQASTDLANRLNLMLSDFEHQLFKQACQIVVELRRSELSLRGVDPR